MEDNLNIIENGRQPQYFWKWKTTSIFLKMEDDLNIFDNGIRPQYIMEEDLNISENGRWPYFLKDDIISWKPQKIKKIMQPRTIKTLG